MLSKEKFRQELQIALDKDCTDYARRRLAWRRVARASVDKKRQLGFDLEDRIVGEAKHRWREWLRSCAFPMEDDYLFRELRHAELLLPEWDAAEKALRPNSVSATPSSIRITKERKQDGTKIKSIARKIEFGMEPYFAEVAHRRELELTKF